MTSLSLFSSASLTSPSVKSIGLLRSIKEDVAAIFQRDPAARSAIEVLFCYPGLHRPLGSSCKSLAVG